MFKRLTCLAVLVASHPLQAEVIKFFNWDGFIAPDVIEQFEQQSGHTVSLSHFDNEMQRDQIIISGRGSAFDLAIVDHMSAQHMLAQGYLTEAPTLATARAQLFEAPFNNYCGSAGYPYAWGTLGILHRQSVTKTPITSWKQLFDIPVEHRNRMVFYMDEVDTVAAALYALNLDPFTEDKTELKLAFDLMMGAKADRLGTGYLASEGIYSSFPKASLALGYAGDEFYLNQHSSYSDWTYTIPDEGTLLWVECLVLPKGRTLKPATVEFIQYISQPEQASKNAELTGFATPVKEAKELSSKEHRQDTTLYPSVDIMQRSTAYKTLTFDALQVRSRMIDIFH
ncbi:polyamine ABC transporter substrate-binding protein [Vibrio ulleungensis]|uniref:Spermidine/putrescine ABC transporter substrate-binding protein n=1 Tax=Vibrio ulleungensis TaxID=2807619 RepID=A0ABS2HH93_9VIBR|nr:spermidine/putrescine ABC transporter substrate-binding protein [Vibrio ulleungensis]MBM7035462.1 spermidine/putrescine ABC transporter substrate-binding protein [Vibrio ulleungensis]